ncbi:uncharacterized protein AB675_6693 [Cyphellophora attinorum]|uniref:Atos-like conserved domain-containing protein n=1 Tax=Cyphellophora attinorum TaxID=1664694 RepID=A0A0N1H8N0_9EURO|nr:uncharacterized protein AB675_6693 [Phialophora attinorum]KPI43355.1 hypothetical protein AB675_6693 [Phialophora attinorum]
MARTRRDSGSSPDGEFTPAFTTYRGLRRRRGSSEDPEIRTSSRDELIQCIKRGQRPTWVPTPNFEALCAEADIEAEARLINELGDGGVTGPAPETPTKPLSALHTGDFGASSSTSGSLHGVPSDPRRTTSPPQTPFAGSPPPWTAVTPFSRFQRTISDPAGLDRPTTDQRNRSRAPSIGSSLSSSYIMRTPTSPLVHATSNLSIDLPDSGNSDPPLPASKLYTSQDVGQGFTPPSMRREATVPMRSHQARRSLTSFTYQPASSASTVYPRRQRRLSHAPETSSLQRNSMVGSFEESILRGRMSAAPSIPLHFVAKIGVSGRGDCPPGLKCPSQVTVPFTAVFYHYPSNAGSRSISDESPSPYVGTINLREHLKTPVQPGSRKRRSLANEMDATTIQDPYLADSPSSGRAAFQTEKSAIGGAYRVPQQGQLQIILKNPENTAVKLFLVPYDLDDMSPDTKTFVRQRSFSTGPVVENVLSDKPIQDPLSSKHVLRYLIHLKFCCIGKGKFYLYDSIRVVFANRVPDGKEQLKNEIQVPEPRYSTLLTKSQPGSATASRRHSTNASFSPSPLTFDSPRTLDTLAALSPSLVTTDLVQHRLAQNPSPISSRKENVKFPDMMQASGGTSSTSRPTSPEYGFERASVSQRGSPVPWGTTIDLQPRSPSPAFNGDGLLSRKLKELGRQNAKNADVKNLGQRP